MFYGYEMANNDVNGDTFTVLLTFNDDNCVFQIFRQHDEQSAQTLCEQVLDDDDNEICDHLHYSLTHLFSKKYNELKNINRFRLKSNVAIDIKEFSEILKYFVIDKYSKILGKRVQQIDFLTNEDKSILKHNGFYLF